MELLRVPPFPLTLTYTGLDPYAAYVAAIANNRNEFVCDVEDSADAPGTVEFELPERFSRYDGEYSVIVYEGTADNKGDVALMDTLRVVRPYIDSAAIAPVGRETEYAKYERIARIMIDNIVGGFYYQNIVLDLQGIGSDVLPLGRRVNKVLEVIENNTLMYELDGTDNLVEYTLTPDKQGLIVYSEIEVDYADSRPVQMPQASSDIYVNPNFRTVAFSNGADYTVSVESGWPMVPQDIKEATSLLIDDMACGVPNYWSKYVREYETKDFRVDFQRTMFAGTGNVIVDQILHRYLGDTLYDNIRVL
jgi:hypothetical protein